MKSLPLRSILAALGLLLTGFSPARAQAPPPGGIPAGQGAGRTAQPSFGAPSPAGGQETANQVRGLSVTLQIELEKGLEARLPSEFDFVDEVVSLVESKRLSRSIVDSCFLWARRKPSPMKMQYFQRALEFRSRQLGVPITFKTSINRPQSNVPVVNLPTAPTRR
jgi:hypothetical protein